MTFTFDATTVRDSLDLGKLIEVVEQLHLELAAGRAVQPPRHPLAVPDSQAVIVPMLAASTVSDLVCFKLLIDNPDNDQGRQRSTIVAMRIDTGECVATVQGAVVTQLRTAAASAVATRALSRPDSRVLGLIGAGAQARSHLRAIAAVRDLHEVIVWNRTPENAERVVEEAAALGLPCAVAPDARALVEASDIVCTLTPAREPIVRGEWLQPGQHLNVVGSPPRPDHREIDSEVLRRATIVVDARDVALAESGAVVTAIAEQAISSGDIRLELGQILLERPYERAPGEITVFTSVGLPIQDLAAVTALLSATESPAP
ncbi:ornithine cyclodeaminase family protein [Amycolatopsis orientalis]|uniref:ornithine cyclodeaminase family protein n=1 Tax=Amycolatopsis orientalis TaxID=31958 RepID=UPI0003A1AFB8|nr:ornithine cyclodeaminase family protein [Amycolatopsis orientalis]